MRVYLEGEESSVLSSELVYDTTLPNAPWIVSNGGT